MLRKMKDSGFEWIGDIPNNWEVRKVKHYYTMQTGFTPDTKNETYYDDVEGYDWVNISDIQDGKIIIGTKKKISQAYVDVFNPSIIPLGSLLYSFKLSVGQVAYAGKPIYSNEAIASFLPSDNINLHYLRYSSMFIIENAQTNIYNAKILNQDLINNAYIVFPPLSEQKAIADFLDKKCAEIDAVVEQTKATIEEYKKLKQSVITEAVTKGIRGDRPMKDSGIEWIGEIPCEWDVSAIKNHFDIYSGATPKSEHQEFWDGDILWITPADYKTDDKYVFGGKRTITTEGYESCGTTLIPAESIIFSKRAPIGSVAISGKQLCTNQGCLACVDKGRNSVLYYYFSMSAFTEIFELYGSGTTFKEISFDSFSSFRLPHPSYEEQQEIADYLEQKCSEIDTLIEKKTALLAEMETYKKSLIFEYVTGKKEVG